MDLGPSTQVENIKWYRIEPNILNHGLSLYELSIREVILITYFVLVRFYQDKYMFLDNIKVLGVYCKSAI